ncbi:uncharacterized protein LY89DRAFT_696307 [Mollisia scopiformis]|uniref:Uncharacterized protein n=1 Tax=Mollisia scopiformis TaxID=149040 RepID=A0A194XFH4_MOLSC|nr:uncharacterized protein LY89DRAFT_696307 [Mollisia scopiformis]KUJ18896.1 hypothetical protein LY89DRAFT_696307 [Mollisia scopiformis]
MESSANQQSSSETLHNNDQIIEATKALRRHIGLAEDPGEESTLPKPSPEPLFFIEVAPPSNRGARCKLHCPKNIMPGEYRIAVDPGQEEYYGRGGNPGKCSKFPKWSSALLIQPSIDYYHIHCFEKTADFSQASFLDRVMPLTRNVTRLKNLKGSSILDGHYLLDAGAERLGLQWMVTMGKLVDKRDGVGIADPEGDDKVTYLMDLINKAGSSSYKPKMPSGMSTFYDGPDDSEEWNLFQEYLAVSEEHDESLDNRHSLSQTLDAWRFDVTLATSENLSDRGKELKAELSPKAIRAIKRLDVTPMPDVQSAFLGRFQ